MCCALIVASLATDARLPTKLIPLCYKKMRKGLNSLPNQSPDNRMLRRISWLHRNRSSRRASQGPPQPAPSSNDSLVQVPSRSSVVDAERDESTATPSTFPVPHVARAGPMDLSFPIPIQIPRPELHVRISDDLELVEAAATITAGPRVSKIEDVLDRGGSYDTHLLEFGICAQFRAPEEKAEQGTQEYSSLDVDETIEVLKSGIDTTWENIRWLMDALEDVAMIHPFVAGKTQPALYITKV